MQVECSTSFILGSFDEESENVPILPVKRTENTHFDSIKFRTDESSSSSPCSSSEKLPSPQSDRKIIEILSSFNVSSVLQNFANTTLWDVREWRRKSALVVRKDQDTHRSWVHFERQPSVNEARTRNTISVHPEEHLAEERDRGLTEHVIKKPCVRCRSTGVRHSLKRGVNQRATNEQQMRYYHVFRAGELDDLIKGWFS